MIQAIAHPTDFSPAGALAFDHALALALLAVRLTERERSILIGETGCDADLATRLVGIPTERVLLGVYMLAGVFYGIASLLAVARGSANPPRLIVLRISGYGQTGPYRNRPGFGVIGEAMGGKRFHKMPENWLAADFNHRFGFVLGFLTHTCAETTS